MPKASSIEGYGTGDAAYVEVEGQKYGFNELINSNDPNKKAIFSAASSDNKLYKRADGSYTANVWEAPVSISVDKSGTIDVKAPQEYFDSEFWKGDASRNLTGYRDELKALSQRYRLNKDYALELEVPKKDGSGKTEKTTKKVSEWIEDFNKDFQESVIPQFYELRQQRDSLNRQYGANLSDYQTMMATQVAGSESSDGTLVGVPEWFALKWLEDGDGYTKNDLFSGGTISKSDLLNNVWNRKKYSDEDILAMHASIEQDIQKAVAQDDKDRVANDIALLETLTALSPNVGFLEGTKDIATQAVSGAVWGLTYGSVQVMRGISNFVNGIIGSTVDKTAEEQLVEIGAKEAEPDLFEAALANADKYYAEAQAKARVLNPNALGVKNVTNGVGQFAAIISWSLATSKMTAAGAQALTNGAVNMITSLSAGAAGKIEAMADELLTVATSNAAALDSGADAMMMAADAASLGAIVTSTVDTLNQVRQVATLTAVTAEAIYASKAVENTVKAVAAIGEIVSDSIMGAIATNPDTFARVMKNTNISDEDKAYMVSQLVQSGFGFGIGLAMLKGSKAFMKTAAGQRLNSIASPRMAWMHNLGTKINNKISSLGGKAKTAVTGKMSYINDAAKIAEREGKILDHLQEGTKEYKKHAKLYSKAMYNVKLQTSKRMLQGAREALAKSRGVKAVKEAQELVRQAQNAVDNLQGMADTYIQLFYSEANPEYGKANREVVSSYAEVARLSKELQDKTNVILTDVIGVSKKPLTAIPQVVSDYIGGRADLKVIQNKFIIDFTGDVKYLDNISFDFSNYGRTFFGSYNPGDTITLSRGDLRHFMGKEMFEQMEQDLRYISDFTKVASSELATAADDLLTNLYKSYTLRQGVMEFGITGNGKGFGGLGSSGFANVDLLHSKQQSGVWGANSDQYIHLQRVQDDVPRFKSALTDKKSIPEEFQTRSWGATSHFKDPMITLIDRQVDDAYRMAMNDFMQVQAKTMPGIFDDVLVSPQEAASARNAKYGATVKEEVNTQITKIKDGKGSIGKDAQAKIQDTILTPENIDSFYTGEKVSRQATTHRPRVSKTDTTMYVSSMDADEKILLAQQDGFITSEGHISDRISVKAQGIKQPKNGYTRLYRGIDQPMDMQFAYSRTGGYSSWTDNFDIANDYAGANGYVYYVDVPTMKLNEVYDPVNPISGDRNLFYKEGNYTYKGNTGTEYRFYTQHEDYAISTAGRSRKSLTQDAVSKMSKSEKARLAKKVEGYKELSPEEQLKAITRVAKEEAETVLPSTPKLFSRNNLDAQLANTQYVKDMVRIQKRVDSIAELGTIYAESLKGMRDTLKTGFINEVEVIDSATEILDTLIDETSKSKNALAKNFFVAKYGDVPEEAADAITDFYTSKYLKDNWESVSKELKGGLKDSLTKKAENIAKERGILKEVTGEKPAEARRKIGRLVDDYVDIMGDALDVRMGKDLTNLRTMGIDTLTENSDIFQELSDLNEKINGVKTDSSVIGMTDGTLVRVDPVIASFYNNKQLSQQSSFLQTARKMEAVVFRLGTTGINPSSIVNQYFKDPINAFINGGVTASMKTTAKAIREEFGDEIANYVETFEPKVYDWYKKTYDTSEELQHALIEREMSVGEILNPNNREYKTYMFRQNEVLQKLENEGVYTRAKGELAFDTVKDKAQSLINLLEKPNEFRESALRKAGYAQGMRDALEQGYTLDQARTFGTFVMNNATTNFGRKLEHLNNFADSIPYFKSAVNGTKSFWRMAELDPVGVMYRMIAGIIVPTVYFTAQNLGSEENRKVYENLREYQRDGNLVIVQDGQAFTIPLPEQLAAFVSPWRQLVEGMHGAETDTFWKLAMNNIVGLSPVDLQGFVNADPSNLLANGFWESHLVPGFSRVASSMLSPAEKSAVMYATGYDPYTNKPIYEGYRYYDPLTGSVEINDFTSNDFAKCVAGLFGGWTSPAMAQKMLESFLGVANVGLIDGFGTITSSIANGEPLKGLETIGKGITDSLSKPLTAGSYDRATSELKLAVRQLNTEKEALLADKDVQTYLEQLTKNTLTAEEKAKAASKVKDRINEYYGHVLNAVNAYKDKFGIGLSRGQFASVLQLMNLETDGNTRSLLDAISRNAQEVDSEQYYAGRRAAIQTMQEMGFTGTQDMSIFGYYKQNADGSVTVEFSHPLAMLEYDEFSKFSTQERLISGNTNSIIKQNNLWDGRKAANDQISRFYNKGKLSKQDKAEMDAIAIAWNSEAMSKLAPYIAEITPESALRYDDVIEALKDVFIVPPYQVGYVSSNKSIVKGNKSEAFAKNYIKYIFKMNDTSYEGGHDYRKDY